MLDTAGNTLNDLLCVIGDTHGHLQLGLCVAARWQQELNVSFDAVLLCGDVGTFTDESQLDSTTRRHAKANPCELEFLRQWASEPPAPRLQRIFLPVEDGGLGLECPVVMVHGNHEGFPHLFELAATAPSEDVIDILDLPVIDSAGFIRYLPSGRCCLTQSGLRIAGIGGIERNQRQANYHEMAYLDEEAILHLLEGPEFDVLISHQGPSERQGEMKGSRTLQMLLDSELPRVWFHGHSISDPTITTAGPHGATVVVPLHDIAFPCRGLNPDDPGEDGWCVCSIGDRVLVDRQRPSFWRDYRKRRWTAMSDGQLLCPDLVRIK